MRRNSSPEEIRGQLLKAPPLEYAELVFQFSVPSLRTFASEIFPWFDQRTGARKKILLNQATYSSFTESTVSVRGPNHALTELVSGLPPSVKEIFLHRFDGANLDHFRHLLPRVHLTPIDQVRERRSGEAVAKIVATFAHQKLVPWITKLGWEKDVDVQTDGASIHIFLRPHSSLSPEALGEILCPFREQIYDLGFVRPPQPINYYDPSALRPLSAAEEKVATWDLIRPAKTSVGYQVWLLHLRHEGPKHPLFELSFDHSSLNHMWAKEKLWPFLSKPDLHEVTTILQFSPSEREHPMARKPVVGLLVRNALSLADRGELRRNLLKQFPEIRQIEEADLEALPKYGVEVR